MMLNTVLLLALPASGKSELRRYLDTLDPAAALDDLHIGPTVQLDDYPYVHIMRRIAEEMRAMGESPLFFSSSEEPFLDPGDWGTLMHLLNFDFADLRTTASTPRGSAAHWLFARLDKARAAAGLTPAISTLAPPTIDRLAARLADEAHTLLEEKYAAIPSDIEDMTVVIEFARGGPEGSAMPLPEPYGYGFALAQLDDAILQKAAILYVRVEPEESRRRNEERAVPGRNGDASILHHGVPEAVMRIDYGTDDLMWLLAQGGGSTIVVDKGDHSFTIPTGVFDNRKDLTSFLRDDSSEWSAVKVQQLHRDLADAIAELPHY